MAYEPRVRSPSTVKETGFEEGKGEGQGGKGGEGKARRGKEKVTGPGATALTLMPLGVSCFARDRVKETIAPFVAA